MIYFNGLGLGFTLLGGVLGYLVTKPFAAPWLSWMVSGFFIFVLDLGYRFSHLRFPLRLREPWCLVHSSTGGLLGFPTWILGLLVLAVGVGDFVVEARNPPAPNPPLAVPKDAKGPPKDVWQDSAAFTLRLAPNGKGESDIYLTNNFEDMRE